MALLGGLDTAKGQLAGMQEMAAIATSNSVAPATSPAWKPPSVDDELRELDVRPTFHLQIKTKI